MDQKIIISHESALEYWRLHRNKKINESSKLRRCSLPAKIPDLPFIRSMIPKELSYPVNLLVAAQDGKRKSKIVIPHVFTGSVPDWALVDVGKGVAVCSPRFCFFQMAKELSLLKLIKLGFEFCGSYGLPAKNEITPGQPASDKVKFNQFQLTNTKELKAITTHMEGQSGQKKTYRALRYIIDGSASPMETTLVMLLSLPQNLGGYGLPFPELNARIDLGKSNNRGAGKSYYKCDLFWPKAKLAVEYDSDMFHTGAERITDDSRKRLDLTSQGITVLTVTRNQIRNAVEADDLAKLVAKQLGKQLRFRNSRYHELQYQLRNWLL